MLASDVRRVAGELFDAHLPGEGWTFAFDRAVRRAGACHSGDRRITLSRHLAERADEDEVRQVLLHEIAHAIAGHAAGHGPAWHAACARIGHAGTRLHDRPIAEDRATWIGTCPAGHVHRRFRRPQRTVSCGACSRRFTRSALITWCRAPARETPRGPRAAGGAAQAAPPAAGGPRGDEDQVTR